MKAYLKNWDEEALCELRFINQAESEILRSLRDGNEHLARDIFRLIRMIKYTLVREGYCIRLFVNGCFAAILEYDQVFARNDYQKVDLEWCPVNFTDMSDYIHFLESPLQNCPDPDHPSIGLEKMDWQKMLSAKFPEGKPRPTQLN